MGWPSGEGLESTIGFNLSNSKLRLKKRRLHSTSCVPLKVSSSNHPSVVSCVGTVVLNEPSSGRWDWCPRISWSLDQIPSLKKLNKLHILFKKTNEIKFHLIRSYKQ
jgi:hypothetical protein